MKTRLRISRGDTCLYDEVHDIIDHDSFGNAFCDAWQTIRQKRLQEASSIGELAEMMNDEVLDQLQGADIRIEKA